MSVDSSTTTSLGASHRALRILVVEDDPDALNATLDLLEALGHWGAGLSSAELALDRYLDGAFDSVITDVNLPGLSGRDLAQILSRSARVPIIFATGQPAPAQLPPRSVWLRKPFSIAQMREALDQAMGWHRRAAGTACRKRIGAARTARPPQALRVLGTDAGDRLPGLQAD